MSIILLYILVAKMEHLIRAQTGFRCTHIYLSQPLVFPKLASLLIQALTTGVLNGTPEQEFPTT